MNCDELLLGLENNFPFFCSLDEVGSLAVWLIVVIYGLTRRSVWFIFGNYDYAWRFVVSNQGVVKRISLSCSSSYQKYFKLLAVQKWSVEPIWKQLCIKLNGAVNTYMHKCTAFIQQLPCPSACFHGGSIQLFTLGEINYIMLQFLSSCQNLFFITSYLKLCSCLYSILYKWM